MRAVPSIPKCFAIPLASLLCLGTLCVPKARAQVAPSTTASPPTVVVNFFTTTATPLNPGFNGFNANLKNAVEYYDRNFQSKLAALSPGWLRFPGGTDSEAFNWATGEIVPAWVDQLVTKQYTHDINANALPIVAGKGGAKFSDFGALAAAVGGAKIIVSVNGYTDTPQSIQAFAQYALTNHIPVAVWELDNEPYTWLNTDGGGPGPFFSNPNEYAANMKFFRDAIKAVDPNAVVSLYFSEAGNQNKLWDNALAAYTPKYWDAVTYHEYVNPGNLTTFDDLMAAANGNLFSNTTSYVTDYLASKNNPGMSYVISEVSPAAGQGGPLLGRLYGGIYTAEFALRMSTLPEVKYVAAFQVLSNAGIDEGNEHLNNVQAAYDAGTTIDTTNLNFNFFISAQAAGEAVANGALHNSVGVYPTTTTGGPTAPTIGGNIPAVYAQAYEGASGQRYVVLTNKSASSAVAQIMQDGAVLTGPLQMTFVTGTDPSLLNTGMVPDNVQIQTQTVTVPGAVTIPPYSVTRLELSCVYTLNFSGQIFPSSGGTGTIAFTTGAGCPWTIGTPPSGVTITSAASGAGSGTVTFQVAPQFGGASSSAFTIAGRTFTIQQQASTIPGLSIIGSMPHLAAEGGWNTTFTLVNKSTTAATARTSLFAPTGNALTLPVDLPQQGALGGQLLASSLDQIIAPNASFVMQASGPANVPFLEGSAQLSAAATNGAVDGFAIFHFDPSKQEAIVPMETRNAPSYLLAFDNTNTVLTGVAIENVSAVGASIPVVILDDAGTLLSNGSITLNSGGHTSFVLSSRFSVTANKRGTIEFDTPVGGQISVLGIRYTPPGTLTTIPALAKVGTAGGTMAHLASGNGWQTTFVLVNAGNNLAQAQLNFFAANGNSLALPLTFPQGGSPTTASSMTQDIPAGASLWIQSAGQVGTALLTGSAQLTTTGKIGGFVIFRFNPNGQEAVVPLENRNASAYLLAFDNTNGTSTGLAVSAVSTGQRTVSVILRDDTGAQIGTGSIPLAANGHTSQDLATQFPTAAGIRGTIEFDTPAGAQISVLGIRSPPTLTFTTLPALAK